MAEVPIYTMVEDGAAPTALAGRIDAMAVEDRKPQVVVDWKSDVGFAEKDVSQHVVQLRDYLDGDRSAEGRARLHEYRAGAVALSALRCVERCCPITEQARRSETPRTWRT